MSDTEKLLAAVLDLPARDRAEFAARLLESLDREAAAEDLDAAWARELERRAAAVDNGELVTSDWNVLRRRIDHDIFGR